VRNLLGSSSDRAFSNWLLYSSTSCSLSFTKDLAFAIDFSDKASRALASLCFEPRSSISREVVATSCHLLVPLALLKCLTYLPRPSLTGGRHQLASTMLRTRQRWQRSGPRSLSRLCPIYRVIWSNETLPRLPGSTLRESCQSGMEFSTL
jgi:hypothetical protein